ncbi:uncharacterized protein An17g01935 [Aspergillus niger]|uniref:Contig An17c0080, genomic contig n=2 Tax=Aspergillus niger TaxID=5061 RepID=A2R9M3_ASPNC|nr:uncharacterized protein An17g01935 [Aspergillus niger]CAK49150.1 unnamed protein product [Aspergillus niger]
MAVVSSRSSMTDWSTVGSVCLGSEIWGFPPSTVFSPPFPVGRPIPDDDDDYDSYGHLNICWLPLFYLLLDTMPTPTSEGKKKATFSDHIIMQAATGPVQDASGASGRPAVQSIGVIPTKHAPYGAANGGDAGREPDQACLAHYAAPKGTRARSSIGTDPRRKASLLKPWTGGARTAQQRSAACMIHPPLFEPLPDPVVECRPRQSGQPYAVGLALKDHAVQLGQAAPFFT